MKPILRLLTLAAALFLSPFASVQAQIQDDAKQGTANQVTLTILHTNDVHGHILPFTYTEIGRSLEEQPSVGGAARRATLIRRIRGASKNPVLVVDSGDTFTRGPFVIPYLGQADIAAMNATGYDLAALGNNEFKAKDATEASDAAGAQAALLQVVAHSRFPWICANATDSRGAMLAGVKPFVVRKVNGLRVGFLGLTAPRVASYPQAKGWTITDAVTAAKKYIPIARTQCDVLIAVTHIGVDLDKQLVAQTTGIDAVVGGDSHTFLYKLLTVKNADGSAVVPIVQDGEFGVNVGKFDLTFAKAAGSDLWRLATYQDALLPVGPDLPEAKDVVAAVAPYEKPLMKVVGTLPPGAVDLTHANAGDRMRQTTQFVVDALRAGTGADYALSPVGSGFFDTFHSPTVRRYDIYAILPFKDHAVVVTRTGEQLRALIAAVPETVVAGPDPATIDASATYRVALMDFIASDTYKIAPTDVTDTGRNVYDLMIAALSHGAKKE